MQIEVDNKSMAKSLMKFMIESILTPEERKNIFHVPLWLTVKDDVVYYEWSDENEPHEVTRNPDAVTIAKTVLLLWDKH
ncbi:MAG: hypothetical protein K0R18_383 [Bacillales bacterium]|jgi:hypothetical protein|nr:hypothetical protein [Bacillales bacterium]